MKKLLDFQRRKPKQARAQATVDSILEAAVQVLQRDGAVGFNTSHVAERAGVSIGTLYQYFPDKDAILLAAAKREMEKPQTGAHRSLMDALIRALESLLGGGRVNRSLRVPVTRGRNTGAKRLVSLVGDVVSDWVAVLLPASTLIPAVSKRQRVARWM
jgi:AcrR family transcriptional regulator